MDSKVKFSIGHLKVKNTLKITIPVKHSLHGHEEIDEIDLIIDDSHSEHSNVLELLAGTDTIDSSKTQNLSLISEEVERFLHELLKKRYRDEVN